MSSWRKFGRSIVNIEPLVYFYVCPDPLGKHFIQATSFVKEHPIFTFSIKFETPEEAMEYLINALREDICP